MGQRYYIAAPYLNFHLMKMKRYKHYSFDLWLTLIKTNPQYKSKRSNYFFKHFNQKNKTEDEVAIIIRDIERMIDFVNQTTGYNVHAIEIVSMILFQLEYKNDDLRIDDMIAIVHMMQQQFLDYPPALYDKDTSGVLHYLHSEGHTLSILSNTAFIIGSTLETVLENLGIRKYLSFSVYSDQVGISKPNPNIFLLMTNAAAQMCNAKKEEILHVGDNPIADIRGAESFGIAAFQINTNPKTIKHLLT